MTAHFEDYTSGSERVLKGYFKLEKEDDDREDATNTHTATL